MQVLTGKLRDRWRLTCGHAAVTGEDTFQQLCIRYNEEQRHYHTLRHLQECWDTLALVATDASVAVDWAIWFHDAVYNPKASDNEAKSAELAVREGRRLGVDEATLKHAAAMILATERHHADDPETQLVLDVDLAILGAPPERFQEYERQIRAEYAWVPSFLYRRARKKVLDGFLLRDPIFHTNLLREHLEKQARLNLLGV